MGRFYEQVWQHGTSGLHRENDLIHARLCGCVGTGDRRRPVGRWTCLGPLFHLDLAEDRPSPRGMTSSDASLRSVTGAAKDLMDHYDEGRRRGKMPDNCVIAFPVVVVDGELFEASFNEQQGKIKIEPANDVRCHWRGSPSWNLHATVDVVTLKGLDAFLSIRREEMRRLLDLMSNASADIAKCFETASTDEFDDKYRTSTLHPLLREAITQIKVKLGASKFDALAPTAPSQGDDQ